MSSSKTVSPQAINIDDYTYDLPEHRIAKFPLEERDASKLLLYKQGDISHTEFRDLPEQLPEGSLLLFNDTKVIHARLYFTLPNGKRLEILCLEPLQPAEYQQNFSSTNKVRWKCLVGGNRKWKSGEIEKAISTAQGEITLKATRLGRTADAFDIQFEWNADLAFGELLAAAGIIPLPPYLNRETKPEDEDRYQTVYAREKGSVAAPTAGLHFTDRVFDALDQKGIQRAFVTLHVGAGTFKPVSADALGDHEMHEESIYLQRQTLATITQAVAEGRPLIPVGTTSLRLLESLYWHACQLHNGTAQAHINVPQWIPYSDIPKPAPLEALKALQQQMDDLQTDELQGYTQLIIAPSYTFRLAKGLITNFHQPRSTLLLLIAAMIGEDWRKAYEYALSKDFRFLSYGDSSLLLP
jgi:S-adenosylmethionine:tRNA ribosyltransferase-isomerase